MSRRYHTNFKARDLQPGMVVRYSTLGGTTERRVEGIERAADAVERLRRGVPTAKTRTALRSALEDTLSALDAVADYGREARLIRFDGLPHAYPCESSREFRYVGERR